MKKLTNVYIKVDKRNHQWLSELFDSSSLELNTYIDFYAEDYRCKHYNNFAPYNKQKVSLAELKRLINTIPTRGEITRLKQQISAYKMNLSLVNERCKELQSDNERLKQTNNELYDNEDIFLKDINHLEKKLDIQADLIRDKNAQLEQLKKRKWWQIWK